MNFIKKHEAWLIFFGSLAVFLYGIFGRELIGFETRFGVFAQEMLRNGPSFFPTTYNQPYPDYPAGLPFLNYLFSLPFGHLTTFTAILPTAIASSLTLVFIYKIAASTDRQWGLIAVLFTLFTYEFIDAARSLSLDPLVMLACAWGFYAAHLNKKFIFLALPMIFGFCVRGPIGLIMPAAVIFVGCLGNKTWRNLFILGVNTLILFSILMLLLISAAEHQGGHNFVKQVLIMQIFGRLDDHRTHNFWAYFTVSFANYALSFELAILAVIVYSKNLWQKNEAAKLLRNLILWVIIILIGMSIPEVRKIRYIMPIVPALALLSAQLWKIPQAPLSVKITNGLHKLFLALPFIFILLTVAVILVVRLKNLDVHAHYFSAFCTLSLLALASIYIFFHHPLQYAGRNPKKVIGIGLASFLIVMIFVVKPLEVSLDRIRPFVNKVSNLLQPNQSVTFFQLGRDVEPIQFVSSFHANNPVLFSNTISPNTNTLYITLANTFDAEPDDFKQQAHVLLRDKLGHREMVVFSV